jgi:hypothetical protein
MITHVAERGEDRGRVVLQMRSGRPSAVALEAAIRIARAFQAELEGLFVEDAQLFDCAAYNFVCEVSLSGRERRAMSPDAMTRALHLAAQGARRQIEAMARQADVPLRCRVVRDEPLRALSVACAETGPWNVIVLAEPFTAGNGSMLKQLLIEVAGATGLVIVGPKARRVSGPAVVALENTEALPGMLRTAERIAALDGSQIVLLLIAEDIERAHAMEADARLAVAAHEGVRIELSEVARGEAAVIAEALRRLRGGFVICQFGGLVIPDEGDLRPLAAALECPLFVGR